MEQRDPPHHATEVYITSKPDAYARPPELLKATFKQFQKMSLKDLNAREDLLDCDVEPHLIRHDQLLPREGMPADRLREIFTQYMQGGEAHPNDRMQEPPNVVYEAANLPGLFIYPHLLPPSVQLHLLDQLFHEHLSDPAHKTNVHMHYDVPYPPSPPSTAQGDHDKTNDYNTSFFHASASNLPFTPKDPILHSPLTSSQFLRKKLRWITLGGQYDWTAKRYPISPPPSFPPKIKTLIESLFPRMQAEAAIVNLYSPGDTLSLHRDVSEECARPLVSVSLGCDGVFVVGGADGEGVVVRLKSGDAVVMEGGVRYAWHGVPRVLEGSCPGWMEGWPAREEKKEGQGTDDSGGLSDSTEPNFKKWRGWMRGKRINLNVRQMFA